MILITGGAGFIGGNYVRYIANEKPIIIDNLSYASNYDYIKDVGIFHHVDITNVDALTDVFDRYKNVIDTVIHFAAESHVDNSIQNCTPFVDTNITGTVNLLNLCVKHNVKKFVHMSTDEVFGSITYPGKFNENSPIAPRNPYSASKAAAEHFVMAYGNTYKLPYIIINSSNNYGPNQNSEKLIPRIIQCIKYGQNIPVYGKGNQVRDWLYVEDTCQAIDLIVKEGVVGERYCIGGDSEVTNLEIVNTILNKIGASSNLIKHVEDRLGHDIRYAIDNSKINALGWKPTTSLSNGLDKTIEWYKNESWI
jgi:dTDP-glucose 4,6-dehydratase